MGMVVDLVWGNPEISSVKYLSLQCHN